MTNIILAMMLGLLALTLVIYLTRTILRSLALGEWMDKWRLRRCVATARHADHLLNEGAVQQAVRTYQQALYCRPARSPVMAEAVHRHHTGLLSRLLAAADQVQGEGIRSMSLARADRLLQERQVLQRRYLGAAARGQATIDLEEKLRVNAVELRLSIASFVQDIAAAHEKIRFH